MSRTVRRFPVKKSAGNASSLSKAAISMSWWRETAEFATYGLTAAYLRSRTHVSTSVSVRSGHVSHHHAAMPQGRMTHEEIIITTIHRRRIIVIYVALGDTHLRSPSNYQKSSNLRTTVRQSKLRTVAAFDDRHGVDV